MSARRHKRTPETEITEAEILADAIRHYRARLAAREAELVAVRRELARANDRLARASFPLLRERAVA
jgi:hypothetical protein